MPTVAVDALLTQFGRIVQIALSPMLNPSPDSVFNLCLCVFDRTW